MHLQLIALTNNAKVPHDLIAPGSSIRPPFSLGSSPVGRKGDKNQPSKPTALTGDVATPEDGANQFSKATTYTGDVAVPKSNGNQATKAVAHTRGVAIPTSNQRQTPRAIPQTRGVAIPMKKFQAPEEPSKSTTTDAAFSGAEALTKKLQGPQELSKTTTAKAKFSSAEAPFPLVNKKRPLPTQSTDENLQQGDLPALKKARKENETALPELPKNALAPSMAGSSHAVSSSFYLVLTSRTN
jgi:hypothetical protein